jgi:hypothetical protein
LFYHPGKGKKLSKQIWLAHTPLSLFAYYSPLIAAAKKEREMKKYHGTPWDLPIITTQIILLHLFCLWMEWLPRWLQTKWYAIII